MEKVRKPSNSACYTSSSEPLKSNYKLMALNLFFTQYSGKNYDL
jgi:hypothetical protein